MRWLIELTSDMKRNRSSAEPLCSSATRLNLRAAGSLGRGTTDVQTRQDHLPGRLQHPLHSEESATGQTSSLRLVARTGNTKAQHVLGVFNPGS